MCWEGTFNHVLELNSVRTKQPILVFVLLVLITLTQGLPVVFVEIVGIKVTAHTNTCAKTSVASHNLYCELLAKDHAFHKKIINLTVAEGVSYLEEILVPTTKLYVLHVNYEKKSRSKIFYLVLVRYRARPTWHISIQLYDACNKNKNKNQSPKCQWRAFNGI